MMPMMAQMMNKLSRSGILTYPNRGNGKDYSAQYDGKKRSLHYRAPKSAVRWPKVCSEVAEKVSGCLVYKAPSNLTSITILTIRQVPFF